MTDENRNERCKSTYSLFYIIQEDDGIIHFLNDIVVLNGSICSVGEMVSNVDEEHVDIMLKSLTENCWIDRSSKYISNRILFKPNLDFWRIPRRNIHPYCCGFRRMEGISGHYLPHKVRIFLLSHPEDYL